MWYTVSNYAGLVWVGESMPVRIASVEQKSICDKKKIKAGDTLLSINGNGINDVLDYRFYLSDSKLLLRVKDTSGKERKIHIRKDPTEDIGLEFETYLMDKQHSCRNKCIFCFIDQLPEGLRSSLYFKDDDSRLSFLFGNYITLTNLSEDEADRIIRMHISPINISVHTMNPELRVKMMANPHAGESLRFIKKFADAGISINAQLVLCPGINDGKELEYSLRELFKFWPAMESVACVPVGLTKHRAELYPLKAYDSVSAGEVIDIIDRLNDEFGKSHSTSIAYASDEFYLCSGRPMPAYEYYNGFPQLENGVGMWTLLEDEFIEALDRCNIEKLSRNVTIVTGKAAYPLIKKLSVQAMDRIEGLAVNVVPVVNNLFGESITVSGLITGTDILKALEGINVGDELIIPPNCLRAEGDMFLDNMTVDELSSKIGTTVKQNGSSGSDLLSAMTGGMTDA